MGRKKRIGLGHNYIYIIYIHHFLISPIPVQRTALFANNMPRVFGIYFLILYSANKPFVNRNAQTVFPFFIIIIFICIILPHFTLTLSPSLHVRDGRVTVEEPRKLLLPILHYMVAMPRRNNRRKVRNNIHSRSLRTVRGWKTYIQYNITYIQWIIKIHWNSISHCSTATRIW